MITCIKIGSKSVLQIFNNRLLSLMVHECYPGSLGSRTGRFNTSTGYLSGYDRLHAFKSRLKPVLFDETYGVYHRGF